MNRKIYFKQVHDKAITIMMCIMKKKQANTRRRRRVDKQLATYLELREDNTRCSRTVYPLGNDCRWNTRAHPQTTDGPGTGPAADRWDISAEQLGYSRVCSRLKWRRRWNWDIKSPPSLLMVHFPLSWRMRGQQDTSGQLKWSELILRDPIMKSHLSFVIII